MINFKKLFETVYEPKSGDEKNFKAKHIVAKYKTPYDTESQFTSDKPKAKRIADHDKGEDEAVYEAAELHTKRADKKPVIVRAVDPKTGQSKAKTVMRRAGEIKIGEEVKLDEKVGNAYAIGMATAMKAAGDTPPLKKSTIVKGHEIAKSIMKKEAMDPVGKADADIDNDGDVDKSDKYLHARRKAIGKAIRKEGVELGEVSQELATRAYGRRARDAFEYGDVGADKEADISYDKSQKTLSKIRNKYGKSGVDKAYQQSSALVFGGKKPYKEEVEELDELDKKTLGSYVKKAAQSRGVAGIVAGGSAHKSKDQKDALKVMKNRMTGISRATDRLTKEEVDQLDELSPNTLHKYIKKATPEVAARAISAVAPNQSAETKKHASKLGKRIAGISSASGRLADKANSDMYEAAEYSMKQLQKKFDDGTHEAMNDPKPGYHVELRNTKTGKRTTHYVKEEAEMIDEAVKIGAMKLHDGSTVNVTREMADSLNGVFEQLNPMNRVKMEQKLHNSKKDFEEILKFAETVNG